MIDWTIPLGTILLAIIQVVMVTGAYYGLKADNARVEASLALAILNMRIEMTAGDVSTKDQVMAAVLKVETLVTDLTHRVTTLEGGQDEWTKALRGRTHELANQVNALMMKVDRLERPSGQEH